MEYPDRLLEFVALGVYLVATVVWGFVLKSPWDVGPALFGFVAAVLTLFVVLPITSRRKISVRAGR
jgi:Na+/H+ antiporter NhaD/arsenite permease-like protein